MKTNQDVEVTPAFGLPSLWIYGVTVPLPYSLSGQGSMEP